VDQPEARLIHGPLPKNTSPALRIGGGFWGLSMPNSEDLYSVYSSGTIEVCTYDDNSEEHAWIPVPYHMCASIATMLDEIMSHSMTAGVSIHSWGSIGRGDHAAERARHVGHFSEWSNTVA
jgi:hypothetical protein